MFKTKKINIFYLFAIILLVFPACHCGTMEDGSEEESREMRFEPSYVGVDAIRGLLEQTDCVGIRFYNASKTSNGGNIGLVAVGIRMDSTEINGHGTRNYSMMEPNKQEELETDGVQRAVAKKYAENVKEGDKIPSYSAVFYRDEIRRLCPEWNCSGFELKPTTTENNDGDTIYTMLMMVDEQEEGSQEGNTSIVSSAPCPPVCPSYDKLLLEPSLEPIEEEDEEDEEDDK
nr:hypothetical protein [Saprospiraceae bacterium]